MIEITSNTALATVQDTGRKNYRHYGIGTSGAMDNLSLMSGNILLGNTPGAASIEIQMFPFEVRFTADCDFSLAGAPAPATLDGGLLPPCWVGHAHEGQVLHLKAPRIGCRTYLALGGGIDVPEILGSRSTQLRGSFGGFHGRMLKRGDHLSALKPTDDRRVTDFGIDSVTQRLGLERQAGVVVRAIPAAEYDEFDTSMKDSFWNQQWQLTPQSNRYGYRLLGDPVRPKHALEIRSHGIVPGVIQIPHGGQPIIQMRDAQPTGGYPKFATVIEADLWRLGQLAIGGAISFVKVDYAMGVQALRENDQYLADITRCVELARMSND